LGRAWANVDAARFEAAIAAPPESEDRRQLIGDLVATLLTSYATAMRGQAEVYVPLEDGLAVMSAHCQESWLRCGHPVSRRTHSLARQPCGRYAFVNREIQKIVKLVESQTAQRPVPSSASSPVNGPARIGRRARPGVRATRVRGHAEVLGGSTASDRSARSQPARHCEKRVLNRRAKPHAASSTRPSTNSSRPSRVMETLLTTAGDQRCSARCTRSARRW